MYAFGSAVVARLGPGPPVPGSLLGLCYPIYALKSAIIAGLGPSPLVPDSWACVILFTFLSQLLLLDLAPVLQFPGPWICGILFMPLGLLSLLVWVPSPPAHRFLPFLDPIHSPKYTGSPSALADLSPVLCSYAVKCLIFDALVIYLSVVLVSVCDNLCVFFFNEPYCYAQEFLFVTCVTSTYNMLLRVVKFLHYCC